MNPKRHQRPFWKSPFKIGLAILSGGAYAAACVFETRLPGDSEWFYCYLVIFALSLVVAAIEPVRYLETAAMPFFAVVLVGLIFFPSPFLLVAWVVVLSLSIVGAFLGSGIRTIAQAAED